MTSSFRMTDFQSLVPVKVKASCSVSNTSMRASHFKYNILALNLARVKVGRAALHIRVNVYTLENTLEESCLPTGKECCDTFKARSENEKVWLFTQSRTFESMGPTGGSLVFWSGSPAKAFLIRPS